MGCKGKEFINPHLMQNGITSLNHNLKKKLHPLSISFSINQTEATSCVHGTRARNLIMGSFSEELANKRIHGLKE